MAEDSGSFEQSKRSAALVKEGLPTGIALFSFEGTHLVAVRHFGVRLLARVPLKGQFATFTIGSRRGLFDRTADGSEAKGREIFENCIEKNFHVSNMKRPATAYFRNRCGCNFRN
jgi:hypothetical protein